MNLIATWMKLIDNTEYCFKYLVLLIFFSSCFPKELQQQIFLKEKLQNMLTLLWRNIDNCVFSRTNFQHTSACSNGKIAIKMYKSQVWNLIPWFIFPSNFISSYYSFWNLLFFPTCFEHLKSLKWVHLFA